MSAEPSDFDGAHFRAVLGHFPTGVTIVTGLDEGAPIGFTIGSFTSISLDPPLVGFFAMNDSDTWLAMAGTGGFCVNVLRNTQADLCWRFARQGNEDQRFDGLAWRPAPVTGSPIIDGVGAWIDCVIERTVVLGDHELVVGAVRALDHHAETHLPLVFYRGALGGFATDG
jgi:3-hydroxy-9,10-secoandrosta-1,3,5(10)-triene-9,17-dione monooxygenase reductase component